MQTKAGGMPNEHGVYCFGTAGVEALILPNKTKGWKGVDDAAIEFAQLKNGKWISAYDCNVANGGTASPLTAHHTFDTRELAISDAATTIENYINNQSNDKNVPRIRKWLSVYLTQPTKNYQQLTLSIF